MEAIRIGIVGSGFMTRAHTMAYNNAPSIYWPALPPVEKVRLADVTQELATAGADRWGWGEGVTDWRTITRADDVDLVDIVTPNDVHAEIAIDAAAHGKHVLCEKPLAHTADAAREMYEAVVAAGVVHRVGFVYRSWPAVMLAKQLIDAGRIGSVMRFQAHFLQDYALDASLPLVWRLQRERSGGGSVGDVGSHLIDLARYLVGDVERVFARCKTFVPKRPPVAASGEAAFRSDGASAIDPATLLDVNVDDAADVLCEFAGGAIGVIQTNWVASGHKIDLAFEVTGDKGSLRFSWQHGNELQVYLADDPVGLQGYRTVVTGPEHPGGAELWPVAGQGFGYSDAFLIASNELLASVTTGRSVSPDFLDGLRACEIVEAALRSDAEQRWVDVARHPAAA
jgi:predicted dehydrogenase